MTFFCIPFIVLYLLSHVKIVVCICMYSILNKILFTLRNSDFIIFSDSLSVLQSLHNRHIENPLLLDVLLKHNVLAELNRIVFCWLPSHVGWCDGAG